jgi:hypothetical protein
MILAIHQTQTSVPDAYSGILFSIFWYSFLKAILVFSSQSRRNMRNQTGQRIAIAANIETGGLFPRCKISANSRTGQSGAATGVL